MNSQYPQQSTELSVNQSEYVDIGPQPNLLLTGILGLALNSVFAIVFGALGRKMGREYVAKGGRLTGSAKVGFVFCKVALILGIVSTALLALSLLIDILSKN